MAKHDNWHRDEGNFHERGNFSCLFAHRCTYNAEDKAFISITSINLETMFMNGKDKELK